MLIEDLFEPEDLGSQSGVLGTQWFQFSQMVLALGCGMTLAGVTARPGAAGTCVGWNDGLVSRKESGSSTSALPDCRRRCRPVQPATAADGGCREPHSGMLRSWGWVVPCTFSP